MFAIFKFDSSNFARSVCIVLKSFVSSFIGWFTSPILHKTLGGILYVCLPLITSVSFTILYVKFSSDLVFVSSEFLGILS